MSVTVTTTLVPTTTLFVPPSDESSIVGYYPSGTEVGTIVCGSEYEFLVSSTYGVCCETASQGNCGFRQRCLRSMMIFEDGTSATCSNNNPCVLTTLYQMEPSSGWSATMAWCVDPENVPTLYRSIVGTQYVLSTSTITLDPTTSGFDFITTTTSARTSTPTTTITSTTTTSSTTTPTNIQKSSGGTNVGAIAGGVVGGVVGLALIVGAVWFAWSRQSKKNAQMREIGVGYTTGQQK